MSAYYKSEITFTCIQDTDQIREQRLRTNPQLANCVQTENSILDLLRALSSAHRAGTDSNPQKVSDIIYISK